jgi:hypothetical protein
MSKFNIQNELEDGEFDVSSATVVRIINAGSNASPAYILSYGTTVPTDGDAGYATGGLFLDTDGASSDVSLYKNGGSATSCNFDALN